MNSTNCNSETVAEHAMALYFATRRSLVTIHNTMADFTPGRPNEWKAKGSMNARMRDVTGAPPRTCREEVAGIVGFGAVGEFFESGYLLAGCCLLLLGRKTLKFRFRVGKQIARLCTALGMKVLISSRKGATTTDFSSSTGVNGTSSSPGRVPFTTLLSKCSVLFLALPLSPTTRSLISTPELALLHPSTTIINVSRGGIVDEAAMLAALTARTIFGYGTDVFATEPAGDEQDSCLLVAAAAVLGEEESRVNLVMTGHLAWLSETTIANQKRKVGENLRAWMEGEVEGDVIVRGCR